MIRADPHYAEFMEEPVITSATNLAEVLYYALRTGQEKAYETAMQRLNPDLLDTNRRDWENAARIKFEYREKKLSLVDGLGYVLAEKNRLQFLTGDRQFEKMQNVKWVPTK
ncbi:MAG TPA: PIN domain-containing protein [Candidatus Norongarragalinales archaeon]|nr:PIN domain-containing protein [Candidatus Norongarragalinales archaeon]